MRIISRPQKMLCIAKVCFRNDKDCVNVQAVLCISRSKMLEFDCFILSYIKNVCFIFMVF